MKVILASGSPRRKELLTKLVSSFEIIPALSDEFSSASDPAQYATDLAAHKAREVFASHPDALVIGCDTVVDLDGTILGKPADKTEATQMLTALSGKTHLVHTGVCVLFGGEERCFCDTSSVTFCTIPDEALAAYVNSGAPLDKAGAYGIQDCGFVEHYCGSYDNVLGLPTEKLSIILDEITKGENYGKLPIGF